jgi:uroporphyrin-III C-methyltransferase/precorrin-2 dehydrogenase/sirohydrochlorin ferrochelatase
MASFLPICLDVSKGCLVVVGGGQVARQKLITLTQYSGNIVVCAPRIIPEIRNLRVRCLTKPYSSDVLEGAVLVYACTDDRKVNRRVGRDARALGIPVCVADDPAVCDFVSPAVFKQGPMSVAVSSNAQNPPQSVAWRNEIRRLFSDRRMESTKPGARKRGKVWLAGFGPGDPQLITQKTERLLAAADVIFYDDLIDAGVLARYSARKEYVGKRKGVHSKEQHQINRKLFGAARAGYHVVRLKGGDPLVFGRGGEELDYLEARGIEVGIVPGVTAATAAAASSRVALTQRGISRSVVFRSAHGYQPPKPGEDEATFVYYMVATRLAALSKQLIGEGVSPKTPAVVVQNASRPNERSVFTTLRGLARKKFESPVTLILGQTAARKP